MAKTRSATSGVAVVGRSLVNRIPRTLAHVQIVKHRQGRKLEAVAVAKAHGIWSDADVLRTPVYP